MQKQTEIDAHLRKRLGEFRDQQSDYWWEIADSTDELLIADEIKQLMSERVLPFLAEHSNDSALAKLWGSGKSPGATEFQRRRYLAAIT